VIEIEKSISQPSRKRCDGLLDHHTSGGFRLPALFGWHCHPGRARSARSRDTGVASVALGPGYFASRNSGMTASRP